MKLPSAVWLPTKHPREILEAELTSDECRHNCTFVLVGDRKTLEKHEDHQRLAELIFVPIQTLRQSPQRKLKLGFL